VGRVGNAATPLFAERRLSLEGISEAEPMKAMALLNRLREAAIRGLKRCEEQLEKVQERRFSVKLFREEPPPPERRLRKPVLEDDDPFELRHGT